MSEPPEDASSDKQRAAAAAAAAADAIVLDDAYYVPSSERLTVNGGYAHTRSSRLKIGAANKGNCPWNKGKNRSCADKAKIKAGVQARNRSKLLKKLDALGMTEQQWTSIRKEIKYVRERVRVTKKSNESVRQREFEMKLMEQKRLAKLFEIEEEEEEEVAEVHHVPKKGKTAAAAAAAAAAAGMTFVKEDNVSGNTMFDTNSERPPVAVMTAENSSSYNKNNDNDGKVLVPVNETKQDEDCEKKKKRRRRRRRKNDDDSNKKVAAAVNSNNDKDAAAAGKSRLMAKNYDSEGVSMENSIFARDVHWTPHPPLDRDRRCYHRPDKNKIGREDDSTSRGGGDDNAPLSEYAKLCPVGGPGGLICCRHCSSRYSKFLSATYRDLETQKIVKVAREAKQLTGFCDDAAVQLQKNMYATVASQVQKNQPAFQRTFAGEMLSTAAASASSTNPTKEEEEEEKALLAEI